MRIYLLLLLLSFGCSSVDRSSTISESVGSIDDHANSIDSIVDHSIEVGDTSTLPTIKNHTKEIRAEGIEIKKREKDFIEEIADLKDTSFFRKAVPWIPVVLGAGIFLMSWLLTKNISDTVFGAIVFMSGIVINILWTFTEKHIGSIFLSLVGFAVVWFIVNYDTRKNKNL